MSLFDLLIGQKLFVKFFIETYRIAGDIFKCVAEIKIPFSIDACVWYSD